MRSHQHLYELAPLTGSTAEELAHIYGFKSLSDFASDLPPDAEVLDVGAGKSDLGTAVTSLRSDITWTNFDRSYIPKQPRDLSATSNPNLGYIQGDILRPPEFFSAAYDRIYSFWMLPHLGLDSPDLVRASLNNMQAMLKDAGKVTVGPLVGERGDNSASMWQVAELRKDSPTALVEKAVYQSIPTSNHMGMYRAINRAGVAIMKYGWRTGQEPTRLGLYDGRKGEYIKALSPKGLMAAGKLAAYLAIEKNR